jgi:hypothetical protein
VNIVLWIMQALLAAHTVMGAVWKFLNSEQTVPSLSGIPHGLWLTLGVAEFVFAAGLVVPALYKPLGIAAPVAAVCIAAEMLLFAVVHFSSGDRSYGQPVYWLVVAAVCAIIAIGRFWVKPL